MVHNKASDLAWRNKTIILLTQPNTSNIKNSKVGVLLKSSLHELYYQEKIDSIIDNHQCKMKDRLYFFFNNFNTLFVE